MRMASSFRPADYPARLPGSPIFFWKYPDLERGKWVKVFE
jgi:hypothetical protein